MLQAPVELEELSTASLSALASPPKRARPSRDWDAAIRENDEALEGEGPKPSPLPPPPALRVQPPQGFPPPAFPPPKLKPLSQLDRRAKKLSPRSSASELVNARAGDTVPSSSIQQGLPFSLEVSLPSEDTGKSAWATISARRASRGTPSVVRHGSSARSTPDKPAREQSLHVVDVESPRALDAPRTPESRPTASDYSPEYRLTPSELTRVHNSRGLSPSDLGAPITIRPPSKHPDAKPVNRHRHSASTPSPSTFSREGRMAAHRQRVRSRPSTLQACTTADEAGARPLVWDGAPPIGAGGKQSSRKKSVQWVGHDVAVVFEVERVDKEAWGEASADYKKNMQTLNMVRRTVPAGTSFAKCVLKMDYMEGGEGASVLIGAAAKSL